MPNIKIETAHSSVDVPVEAIRVYIPELMKEIDSSRERARADKKGKETPIIRVKRQTRNTTGKAEVEIVFLGDKNNRHIEKLCYYKSHPDRWVTWGIIVLNKEQTEQLRQALEETK